ncbi:hypothetical protein BGZ68_001578 [Mortierella alpina]|nr:hypothetical protein BGZ68_001578 [Mortierella alpina]
MHRKTFTSVLVCFLALLSLTAAQSACSTTVPCADSSLCCSPAGFCGTGDLYCGAGCQNGPCLGGLPSASGAPPSTPSASNAPLPSSDPSATTTESILPTSVIPTIAPTTVDSVTTTTTAGATSTRATFQLQPTGKPSGAGLAQDKAAQSKLALVIVVLAGLLMA